MRPRSRRLRLFASCALVIAGCASPLTVAEPRDGGVAPPTGGFGDAGTLEGGDGSDADFLSDPVDGDVDG